LAYQCRSFPSFPPALIFEVKQMDLSKETIQNLFFEQVKELTLKTKSENV